MPRGKHPNSLANLKPFKPGEAPRPPATGPIIVPALRMFANMTLDELKTVDKSKLTGGQAIALGMIIKAATDGAWGDKTREQVVNRLDGPLIEHGASATAIAQVVNIIRGGDDLGMLP